MLYYNKNYFRYTRATHNDLKAAIGRIHFAGEAYMADYYAYLHGALLSAQEVVNKIVNCMENSQSCQQYIPEYLSKSCDVNTESCDTNGVLGSRIVWKYIYVILLGCVLLVDII